MSVSLSNSLEDKFGIAIPIAELISGPTINQLVDGVFRDLNDGPPAEGNQLRGAAAAATSIVNGKEAAIAAARNDDTASVIWTDGEIGAPAERPPSAILRAKSEQRVGIANGQKIQDDRPTPVGSQTAANGHASSVSGENAGPRNDFDAVAKLAMNPWCAGARKWLIATQPNPAAKARLFCLPLMLAAASCRFELGRNSSTRTSKMWQLSHQGEGPASMNRLSMIWTASSKACCRRCLSGWTDHPLFSATARAD